LPDIDGRLSEEEDELILDWLNTHPKGGMKCVSCGSKSFTSHSHVTAAPVVSQEGISTQRGYDMLGIICDKCALIHWFDADMMGIGTKVTDEPEGSAK
jgi:hypothetical protein